MGRRSAGFAVMIVTLSAVVVISAHMDGARGIPGSAQAGPVPPPPVIGQCLLEPTGRFEGWGFGEPVYPALRLAPCTGDRWGEVVSILPGALATPTSVNTTDSTGAPVTENPTQSRCDRDRLTYLGAPARRSTQWGWQLPVGTVAAVGPTRAQQAAGQSWVACIITPANRQAATSARYHGSTQNALNNGVLPVAFATCSNTTGAAGILPGPCDRPHHAEIFGVATTASGDTQQGVDAHCLKLVKWLMRTADPTKRALLRIRAFTSHTNQSGTAVLGLGPNGDAICIVEPAGDRNLHGTLFGLGLNPIPWA